MSSMHHSLLTWDIPLRREYVCIFLQEKYWERKPNLGEEEAGCEMSLQMRDTFTSTRRPNEGQEEEEAGIETHLLNSLTVIQIHVRNKKQRHHQVTSFESLSLCCKREHESPVLSPFRISYDGDDEKSVSCSSVSGLCSHHWICFLVLSCNVSQDVCRVRVIFFRLWMCFSFCLTWVSWWLSWPSHDHSSNGIEVPTKDLRRWITFRFALWLDSIHEKKCV